jgi:hypothetical protein
MRTTKMITLSADISDNCICIKNVQQILINIKEKGMKIYKNLI